ncbi:MAG: cyclic nucleotide-binding domain-containing protein [Candidatus Dormibacteria bacterium]
MGDRKLEAIRRVPLFAQCSKKELEFIAAQMDEIEVAAGTKLTTQGKHGHSFYILLDGSSEVVIGNKAVATLKPGDFFGEISMIDRGDATATVTTTSPSTVLVLSHQQFRDAITGNEKIAIQVMQAMAQRLRQNEAAGLKG